MAQLDQTSFFGDPSDPGDPAVGIDLPGPPLFAPPADDIDLLADELADLRSSYGENDEFGDSQWHEPTPALLAAKAEPLGEPAQAHRPARKTSKPSRPAKSARSSKSDRPASAAEAARLSKARAQTRRKPKEPSKILLAVASLGVILVGVAAAWYFTQRDSGPEAAVNPSDEAGAETTASSVTDPSTEVTAAPAGPAATTGPPTVMFDDAAVGPINSATPYTVAVKNAPADATLQLLVDGAAQAEPAAQMPPVTFAPGRHLLVVNIASATGTTATDPVVVYALGETPPPGYRANLASINVETEGWAEAVRRFDEYIAQGHNSVKLMPSDPYPSLKPGFWNIFVDGFADEGAAAAYCGQYNLSIPDQCFTRYFDADAPASG